MNDLVERLRYQFPTVQEAMANSRVAADEIERLRAEVDGWRKAHTLCLEAIERLSVGRFALRAIVSDLAAIPMHRDISVTIGALVGRAREAINRY